MAKHVHFAEDNAVYSPTPSPTSSLSSLPSLSSPPTPPLVNPPIFYPRTPYEVSKENPLPTAFSDEMHIHFLLAFAPYGAPPVQYNLSVSPSVLLESQVSLETFSDSATEPPLASLRIQCPNLPRLISVTPSSTEKGFVTVADVFYALYDELRLSTRHAEYETLSPLDAREVDLAYFTRCQRFGPAEARQLEKGIKRLDFLMGKTRFLGLSATLQGPDIWELNVS